MKRTNVLRLIAVVGVLVLATMMTGCLKSAVTATVNDVTAKAGEDIKATVKITVTGFAKGGTLKKVAVEFLDDKGEPLKPDAVKIAAKDLKAEVTVGVFKRTATVVLDDLKLTVPDEAVVAKKVKFTLTGADGFTVEATGKADVTAAGV